MGAVESDVLAELISKFLINKTNMIAMFYLVAFHNIC